MPRNKRKHPHTRYERIMLACIDSLPFKFHSPGQPNIPQRPDREEGFSERHTPKPVKLQRLQSSPGPEFKPSTGEHIRRQLSDRTSSPGKHRRVQAVRPGKEAMN